MSSQPIPQKDADRSLQLALAAARTAAENRGQNLAILDLRELTPVFDYFVLATGASGRQLRAMSEDIDNVLEKQLGDRRMGVEGFQDSKWILLDYGSVVVHLLDAELRTYYDLENLWGAAKRVDLQAHGIEQRRDVGMNILSELKGRFRAALIPLTPDPTEATPEYPPGSGCEVRRLPGELRDAARQAARQAAARGGGGDRREARTSPTCASTPEIAGPGFINLRLTDDWLADAAAGGSPDDRSTRHRARRRRRGRIVVDYSSPNVAKPMHVGHIRSTVIGDALYRVLKFLGHRTISDNHIGDWGTQFGMIIYGWKHFGDEAAFKKAPVPELTRLYRLVNTLVEYHAVRDEALPAAADKGGEAREPRLAARTRADAGRSERSKRSTRSASAKRKGNWPTRAREYKELEAKIDRVRSRHED